MNLSRIKKYSRAKFGELDINFYFAEKISKLIYKNVLSKKKKCVIYFTKREPRISIYTNNSEILAKMVSKILKLPCIIGKYKRRYNKKHFYDNQIKRKSIATTRINAEIKEKYKNYTVIMVDDSILTGTVFKASLNALKSTTKDVYLFTIANLKDCKFSEKEVNNFYYSLKGIDYLIFLLNLKKPIISGQLLRTIDDLNNTEVKRLLKNIPVTESSLLKKAFKHYIGRKLN
jgi:hypothetical protein